MFSIETGEERVRTASGTYGSAFEHDHRPSMWRAIRPALERAEEGYTVMPTNHGPITPEQQRRFEAARRSLEQMCPGRERRRGDWMNAGWYQVAPCDLERARWLLVAMGRARGTEGGEAVARLAERGYVVTPGPGAVFQPSEAVMPFDAPGVVYLGLMLPGWRLSWKSMEAIALDTPLEAFPPRRWCTAHETLGIAAALAAEGHDLG
jgi:hypothetical protein